MKRLIIFYNPIAGQGRSPSIAHAVSKELCSWGAEVTLTPTKRAYELQEIRHIVENKDLVIVAGGDGSLMPLLMPLAQVGCPVYMLPTGNESLFAREFNMSKRVRHLIADIERGIIDEVPIARVNDLYFFSMVSVGLDSQVVARIAQRRSGPIGHIGYVLPTLSTVLSFKAPQLDISVDGQLRIEGQAGYLIIANTRQYAQQLLLVPEIEKPGSRFLARYFPYKTFVDYLPWLLCMALKRPPNLKNTVLLEGEHFSVKVRGATYPVQADGEYAGATPIEVIRTDLRLRILRGLL